MSRARTRSQDLMEDVVNTPTIPPGPVIDEASEETRPARRSRTGTITSVPATLGPPVLPPLANLDIDACPDVPFISNTDKVFREIGGFPHMSFPFSWEAHKAIRSAIAACAAKQSVPQAYNFQRFYSNTSEDEVSLAQVAAAMRGKGKMPHVDDYIEPTLMESSMEERGEVYKVLKVWPLFAGEVTVVWR